MHSNDNLVQLGHLGPAWRDIVLSRRGYAQANADNTPVDKIPDAAPDAYQFGLNKDFPSFFSNPFRSPDAGDLVPLPQMLRYGVDAGWLRRHHFNRGGAANLGIGRNDDDNNGDLTIDDSREAGYGGDDLVFDSGTGALLPVISTGADPAQSGIPLFSETFNAPFIAGERNSYMMYQPMSRLGNLVTNRSGVFAVWITVGYFEVEKAPSWNDPNPTERLKCDALRRRRRTPISRRRSRRSALQPRLPRRLHAGPRGRHGHGRRQAAPRVLHHRPHGGSRLQAGRRPERRENDPPPPAN